MIAEADRILGAGIQMMNRSVEIRAEAARLIGRNAQAPAGPLFEDRA